MLEIRDVTHSYGDLRALESVSLQIESGEVVALAGENGSGKSTLSKIICGGLTPDTGELIVDSRPCHLGRPLAAKRQGIALVPQEPMLLTELTVAENLSMSRLIPGVSLVRRRKLVDEARRHLDRIGLDVDPRQKVSELEVERRAMLAVAYALATDPRYVIFDETTSRLNERDVEALFKVIRDECAAGVGVVLITHRLREVCELADRAVVLRDGRNVAELDRSELVEDRLATAMVGRELDTVFNRPPCGTQSNVLLTVDQLVVGGTEEPVSLGVRAGEVVGLGGLAGSGRTEILETIVGARKREGGTVSVGETVVSAGSPAAAVAAGISIVPEDRHSQGLHLEASIRENVAVGTWPVGRVRIRDERTLARGFVERLRIRTPSVDTIVSKLSGGNQQKVVFARCLVRSPRVLLLDEPTRGVDVGAKLELYKVIGQLAEEGAAVLLASSEMIELIGLCDRVLVLHEHRIVGELTGDEITEERIALLAGGELEAAA